MTWSAEQSGGIELRERNEWDGSRYLQVFGLLISLVSASRDLECLDV